MMVPQYWIISVSIQSILLLSKAKAASDTDECVNLSRAYANSFLTFPDTCCSMSSACEALNREGQCQQEPLREFVITKYNNCPPGSVADKILSCHFVVKCTDIDECVSQPCQNGGTCENVVYSFTCICPPKFYGDLCDTHICHPTPADIVFVLDSSLSMTEDNFIQQVAFVSNFTDYVTIGPHDFQISVITFSTEARVEFFLNDHPNKTDLKVALGNITFKPGATFTDKGLQLVKTEVFRTGRGIERRFNQKPAKRFIYLLTDGMSNERIKTIQAATDLKDHFDVTIAVIGIGLQISHPELLNIASRPDLVFSLSNFNSLYTLLKELVQHTCSECIQSSRSDISIIVDVTNATATDDFMAFISSVRSLAKVIDLSRETRISVSTFDDSLEEFIALDSAPTADDVILATTYFNKTGINARINITAAILAAAEQLAGAAGPDAKRFIITMTTGNFSQSPTDSESVGFVPPAVIKNGIEIIAMANRNGQHNNITNLFQLATDPFNVFLVDPNAMDDALTVLTSSFTYNKCNLTEE